MKRFWKRAHIEEQDGQIALLLDGRNVFTPQKKTLVFPAEKLAQLVCEEWDKVEGEVKPDAMPIFKLTASVLDLMPQARPDAMTEIIDYASSDALCYFAPEPEELCLRQKNKWEPWLKWISHDLQMPFTTTTGIVSLRQPTSSLERLEDHLKALGDWQLIGLHSLTKSMSSVILALAVFKEKMGSQEAFETAYLDEIFGMEKWGVDEEQKRRLDIRRNDIAAAGRFIRAL